MEPVDYFWNHITPQDAKKSALFDLQRPLSDRLRQCIQDLSGIISQPLHSGMPSTAYWRYVGADEEAGLAFACAVTQLVVCMIAQSYSRNDLVFEIWPFPMTRMLDLCVDAADSNKVFARFWEEPWRRLDPECGEMACLVC